MPNVFKYYKAPDPSLWQGRKDSLAGERFFQHVQMHDLSQLPMPNAQGQVALVGFASDEGVKRNEGRPGASLGPAEIRKRFAKLACHSNIELIDVGDIVCLDGALEEAQIAFGQVIAEAHQNGFKTLAFGGGHEIAWGHYLGLCHQYPELAIINIDAHFDLRPLRDGHLATSGTAFWQILKHRQALQRPFQYCVLGIQAASNTKSLYDTAHEAEVSYLTAAEIQTQNSANLAAFLEDYLRNSKHIYLTICMDVFAESIAAGVSAPQALGLYPKDILPLLNTLVQSGKVIGIDFAEYSPPLDKDGQTARLCAELCATLMSQWC